jgi:hypothetical protein
MSDNKEIRFPVEANIKLKIAADKQRNRIEIICNGTGLHWPELDEDLSVTGIIEGRYGYYIKSNYYLHIIYISLVKKHQRYGKTCIKS